jgi:hypothetical protein
MSYIFTANVHEIFLNAIKKMQSIFPARRDYNIHNSNSIGATHARTTNYHFLHTTREQTVFVASISNVISYTVVSLHVASKESCAFPGRPGLPPPPLGLVSSRLWFELHVTEANIPERKFSTDDNLILVSDRRNKNEQTKPLFSNKHEQLWLDCYTNT